MINSLFPRRLHRMAYFFRGTVADIVTFLLYSNITAHSRLWWVSIIAIWIYGAFFIVLPRIRDIEMSAWWVLATFIPFVNAVFGIILLFRPPARSRNNPDYLFQRAAAPVG